MIITAITIENFKSIKRPVRIELKPITMLFGINSVGKSTVVQALHYAREILVENNPDADRTETGGDFIRLGGFRQIVHNHDCNRSIRFKFEFNLSSENSNIEEDSHYDVDAYDQIVSAFRCNGKKSGDQLETAMSLFQGAMAEGTNSWIELVVSYDSELQKPYISLAAFGLGEMCFIELRSNGKNSGIQIQLKEFDKLLLLCGLKKDSATLFSKEDFENSKLGISSKLPWIGIRYKFDDSEYTKDLKPMSLMTGDKNDTKIMDFGRYNSGGNEIVAHILDALYYMHVDALANDLENFRYIGPLRIVPNVDFIPHEQNSPSRWSNGVAAWDNILLGDDDDTRTINKWLSEKHLNTGYKIVLDRKKELALDSDLYKALISKAHITDEIVDLLQHLPVKTKLSIRHSRSEILLHATDVGVGIAQVLPIIPLALGNGHINEGIIAIEQPELHTHPAMQVVLGDLFIEGIGKNNNSSSKKRFILETHSEHMLLRMLRRLRDPIEGVEFGPEDLSINFMEEGSNGVIATRIRVDEEGEFKDLWPRGFFSERSEELF